MALYGQNLADTIPDNCTFKQATEICGILEPVLTEAQGKTFQGTAALVDTSIEPENVEKLKAMLADEWVSISALDTIIQAAPDWSAQLDADTLATLRGRVMTASDALKIANDWYRLPSWSGISDGIVAIVGGISNTIANAVSKAAGNLIGGLWWVIALAIGGLWLASSLRRRASA